MRDVEDADGLIEEVPQDDRPAAAALMNLLRITHARAYQPARIWECPTLGRRLQQCRTTLSAVELRCTQLGVGLTALNAQGYLALTDAIEGDHHAHQRATAAREVAGRRGWTREPQARRCTRRLR